MKGRLGAPYFVVVFFVAFGRGELSINDCRSAGADGLGDGERGGAELRADSGGGFHIDALELGGDFRLGELHARDGDMLRPQGGKSPCPSASNALAHMNRSADAGSSRAK